MFHELPSERPDSLALFNQPQAAAARASTPQDLSKEMSLFDLDESLCLLLDSALEAAEENNGEIPPEIQQAILTYCEAFGEKLTTSPGTSALRKPSSPSPQRKRSGTRCGRRARSTRWRG